jgi:hypothetical protein
VLAVHTRSTSAALLAVAEMSVGEVGGWLSVEELTTTVTVAVLAPTLFEAVNLYVVVCVGDTAVALKFVTFPTPLSMLIVVAPETLQESVTGWPGVVLGGAALNEEIAGICGPGEVLFQDN